ncbi:cytochrome c biogenesis protein ResB, partial [Streptosporangium sandarakinum]
VTQADPLADGQKLDLPGGAGSIEFTGVKEWVALQITHDPGRMPALVFSALAVLGLVLSLTVRRRRVWVRVKNEAVATGEPDRSAPGLRHIEVGGLTRTEGGDFGEEFAEVVAALNPGVKDAR